MRKKKFISLITSARAAAGVGLVWLGLLAAAPTQAQALIFTNAMVSGGYFSFNILAASNTTCTIQVSTDLKNWQSVGKQSVTSGLTAVMDPRPVSGFQQQYYRLALGLASSVSYSFNFLEFANPGNFDGLSSISETGSPVVGFPMSWNSYSAVFTAKDDTNFPAATNVFFTGPAGSGLSNSAGDPSNSNTNSDGSANYQSPIISSPPDAVGGTWVVNYKGSNVTFNVSDPQVNSRIVMPYPTVTVSGGNLVGVSWIYRDATTGATLSGAPAYVANIQLQVYGGTGSLYTSTNLAPSVLSQSISPPIATSTISGIGMAYQDTAGNNYVVSYGP